jgi:hypothetical protein
LKLATINSPTDLTDLINMKAALEKLSVSLFETGRYRDICEDLQTLKISIMHIPECKVLEPFNVKAREYYCLNG